MKWLLHQITELFPYIVGTLISVYKAIVRVARIIVRHDKRISKTYNDTRYSIEREVNNYEWKSKEKANSKEEEIRE